jgi:hypothetical protein
MMRLIARALILPVPQAWGGGPPPQAVVEGQRPRAIAPPSVADATATSPSLRDREDLSRQLAPTHPSLYAARMPAPLDHIDSWIFDLDNTLYAPSAKLFDLIDARMGAFIMRLLDVDAVEARRVQKQYFHDHGTTMAGLMRHHGVDPEDFLVDVHDIALDRLSVEARDGKLVISERQFAGDEKRRGPRGPVTVRINAANLRAATLSGAGSLQIDKLKGQRAMVGLRGPGRLVVGQINTDRLQVAMIGNGTMTLGGAAKNAQMTLSGAGAVDAGALSVDELISDSEGAGDHILRAVKSAAITTRGIGKTVVLGKPVCTVRNIGSGSVTCGNAK